MTEGQKYLNGRLIDRVEAKKRFNQQVILNCFSLCMERSSWRKDQVRERDSKKVTIYK